MMNPAGRGGMQKATSGDPYSKHNWNTNVNDDVADEADEDDDLDG